MAKATGKKKVFRKKEKKHVPMGIAHVAASFNNTMISITDLEGNLIAQSSAGARGFRGSRKGTPFAAQQAAYEAAKKAHEAGMQQCEVRVKGPGGGRESAIRAIANAGIRVVTIRDTTPIPHNGCRPPKRRKVEVIFNCRMPIADWPSEENENGRSLIYHNLQSAFGNRQCINLKDEGPAS